jgi:hypothetical protein
MEHFMPGYPEEQRPTMTSWFQLFQFLLSTIIIAFVVIRLFEVLFGPSPGGAQ